MKEQNKMLLLESDPSVFTTNHGLLARLLDSIQCESVAAIYDPGNDIYDECGEIPYPAGYDLIKKYIRHVHIKDAVRDKNNEAFCVKIGTGKVDYRGLLHELKESGYQGWYSMETHYRKQAVISEELMRLPGGKEFSEGGLEATAESIEALKALMLEEGML
jgi:sugar phosphate isomerase/epimerase